MNTVMNTKNVVAVAVVVLLIVAAVVLLNRNESRRSDLSTSLDRAADNIEEGVNDAKRNIEDATD